jgi:tetratricopeptide (TPR) repeat protein
MDEADPLYRQAIELFPKDDDLHREYAVALVSAGKLDDGEAQLQAAMELDARDPSSILFKAMLLLKRQKFDEAVGTLRAGIELNPKDIKLRDLLVFVLHGAKVYSEAYAEQLELRKLQPESIDVEEKLIVYASKMRRSDLAERHIARLRELQIAQNKQEDSFARDEFWIGKQRVIVAEHFEKKGDPGYKYEFYVCDQNGREQCRVVLFVASEINQAHRKWGKIKDSEQVFVLAKQVGEEVGTFHTYKTLPTYDQTRALAIEMIESDDESPKQPPAPSQPPAERSQPPASK